MCGINILKYVSPLCYKWPSMQYSNRLFSLFLKNEQKLGQSVHNAWFPMGSQSDLSDLDILVECA